MIGSDVFIDLDGSGMVLATLVLGFGYRGQFKWEIWDNKLFLTLFMCGGNEDITQELV